MADALVASLSRSVGSVGEPIDGLAPPPLLADDFTGVVHQAVGIVAEQAHCDTSAALALIMARAFADDVPSPDLAARIVAGDLRLVD